MKLGIIGAGYVGLVSGVCFAEIGHRVICADKNEAKIKVLQKGGIPFFEPELEKLVINNLHAAKLSFTKDLEEAVIESEIIFIAVGTPPLPNGEADLSQVFSAAADLARAMNSYKIIVIKSTVPIGTHDKVREIITELTEHPFHIASVPEFLREGSAIYDAMHSDRVIIGCCSNTVAAVLEELHKPMGANFFLTDPRSAEMIKYASNAFLATKISFINEIASICEKVGANISQVADGMGLDARIGRAFLNAGLGFGGSCFPKDTKALIQIAGHAQHNFELLKAVVKVNKSQRKKVLECLEQSLGDLRGKEIGILGLAFKPNTDDMREAPAVEIIKSLKKRGAKVRAYDPAAQIEAKKIMPDIQYCQDSYQVAHGAEAIVLVTEWDEFSSLDLDRIKQLMKRAVFFDGRNIFDPRIMLEKGFSYFSIGRPNL